MLAALSVALLAMTLGGCFLSVEAPHPPKTLVVEVPRECKRILRQVPDPGVQEGQPLDEVAAGYRGAWLKGNRRIAAGAACEDGQADLYRKAK
ncbi:hypothetical protein [Bradyrhizobium sp. SZCCHNR1085]|uniref:hypothetical protein n=1 Tax=Bradyrhizobium sp. SZCCHNR1085 TaxID=3057365 RepID=UPI00291617EC|nr:hypothetical protein [Bradyrhizobium sp. SZCCHNR1085]